MIRTEGDIKERLEIVKRLLQLKKKEGMKLRTNDITRLDAAKKMLEWVLRGD